MIKHYNNYMQYLVGWFASFQFFHFVVLLIFLIDPMEYLYIFQPKDGWGEQSVLFLIGWSITDASFAVLSILVVYGWFHSWPISSRLLITLVSSSFYSALLFIACNWKIGTLENVSGFLFGIGLFAYLPVLWLWIGLLFEDNIYYEK